MRETFEPLAAASEASLSLLQGLLSVTREQAELVKNPLTLETRKRVNEIRHNVVVIEDEGYSPLLREIIDPPLALHLRGEASLTAGPCVAIVGSRKASPYGINAARRLARDLVSAGVVIVSGLARGIDAAAHEAALEAGGKTIAVLGTGIDVVYPRTHGKLFRLIEQEGLIVSEFGPGTPPLPENFPIRNRVISGMSWGTIIVEATTRSGSLITARMAAEQGREVFAVPGSIFSAGSEGTHRLIQYGAKLVHDVDDVLDELPGGLVAKKAGYTPPDSPLREILEALSLDEATHLDSLAEKLSTKGNVIAESLLQLELDGWIRTMPGSRYVRVK